MTSDSGTVSSPTRVKKGDVSKMMGFILHGSVVQAGAEDGLIYSMGKSLRFTEQRLNPARFFRINRCCIINRKYILCLQSAGRTTIRVCMSTGFPMQYTAVSQKRLAKFRKWVDEL